MKKPSIFRKIPSNGGYTVIELIVALCISIFVAAGAITFALSFFDSVRISALDTKAENICLSLQKQITAAISDGYTVFADSSSESNNSPSLFEISKESLTNSMPAADYYGTEDIIYLKSDVLKNEKSFRIAYADLSASDAFIVEIDIAKNKVCGVICSDSSRLFDLYDSYTKGDSIVGISERDISSRRSADILLGYFSMPAAEGSQNDVIVLTPQIEIFNRDEICLTVKTPLPQNISGDSENVTSWISANLTFTGRESGTKITFNTQTGNFIKNDNYAVYTSRITESSDGSGKIILSLDNFSSRSVYGDHYFVTGEDIEITAEISYTGSENVTVQNPKITIAFNPFYSFVTTDEQGIKTAYIDCGRHLQNIGRCDDIKKYVLCNDIDWSIKYCLDTPEGILRTDDNREIETFIPLDGRSLSFFDGRGNKIQNLRIRSSGESVGFFAELGSDREETAIIKNCSFVNFDICIDPDASQFPEETRYVGALAGKVCNADVAYCSAYRALSESSGTIQNGSICGGLIGKLSNSSVSYSFASTSLIGSSDDDSSICGGLIGTVTDSSISECYSCSEMITSSGIAGGFIGSADLLSSITHSYSVAEISSPVSAGFVSAGLAHINNCYAILRPTSKNSGASTVCYGFSPGNTNVDSPNTPRDFPCCYILDGATESDLADGSGSKLSYDELSTLITKSGGKWIYAGKKSSYFYKLGSESEAVSDSYPFPVVKSISEYRGWWPTNTAVNEPIFITFAYYEIYHNGDVGISFTDAEGNKIDTLKYSTADVFVTQDGYAAIASSDIESITARLYDLPETVDDPEALTLFKTNSDFNNSFSEIILNYSYDIDVSGNKYMLYPLSYSTLSSERDNFYNYIVFDTSDSAENEFLFCPDFADTVISASDITNNQNYPLPKEVSIRSPRHLVSLGRDSLSCESYMSKQFNYVQTISIDYSVYTDKYLDSSQGTDIELIQSPIGSPDKPFSASFNGGEFTISNLLIELPNEDYVGLFGAVNCSADTDMIASHGYMTNIRLVDPIISGQNYVGAIIGAAVASGEANKQLLLNNCGVYLSENTSYASVSGINFTGGVIGFCGRSSFDFIEFDISENNFEISAENISLAIANSFAAIPVCGQSDSEYIGGFIGLSSADIYYSYSSGPVSGNKYIGGFVGAHIGTVDNGKIYYCYSSSNVVSNYHAGSFVGRIGSFDSSIAYSYSVGAVESDDAITAHFYGNIDETPAPDIFDCIFLSCDSSRDKLDDILFGERDYSYFSGIRNDDYSPDYFSDSFYYYILPNTERKCYPYSDSLRSKLYPFAMIGEIRPYGFFSADDPIDPKIDAIALPHYGDWPQE